jgi:hypothetical protein
VTIEALHHSSRTSHHTLPTDMLTYVRTATCVLAQNDALEYTRRIGRLPHDDARTHKSLEKCRRYGASGCPRVLRDPLRPPNALAPRLRILTAAASASRASSASSSISSAVSTWTCVNGRSTKASPAAPAGSAGSWGDRRRSPCSRRCRARNFVK